MDYRRCYYTLLTRALGRDCDVTHHRHHVIPKYFGGDRWEITVGLTWKEHALIHRLIPKAFGRDMHWKSICSYNLILSYCRGIGYTPIRAWVPDEEYRRKLSIALTGRVLSETHRENLRNALPSGKDHYMYGQTTSDKQKAAVSKAHRGKPKSAEQRKKISESQPKHWLGKTLSDETKHKKSESMKRYWARKKAGLL